MSDNGTQLKESGRDLLRESGLVLGIFVLASAVGALIWKSAVDLPRWQQTGHGTGNIAMDAISSTKTIGVDAVYLFVAVPVALALGAALMWWRRASPTRTVVLVVIGGVCAAALMERFGLWWGPGDPAAALASAAKGATAPIQLQVQATGVLLAWPVAAALGALLVLLFAPPARFESASDVPEPLNSAL